MPDPGGWPKGGAPAWGNGYLPATYQGTVVRGGSSPVAHLQPPPGVSAEQQRRTVDFVAAGNRDHLAARAADSDLAARIAAYELAFRMQVHAPEVADVARETAETRKLYGLDRKETAEFGLRCLLARRMVERGVRFVQVYSGDTHGWDAHSDLEGNHGKLCLQIGRTPMTEGTDGRDHNPHGFSMWLAGGGVKGGQVIGATDSIGLRAAEGKAHVNDIHATILYLLGFNHRRLTYRHNGRNERLTDNGGEVIEQAIA
jgi:uncharacterized protein (DUF1501 family)